MFQFKIHYLSIFGIFLFLMTHNALFSDSSTTTLTNPEHIKVFNEVTSQIRCICLPSLPIKSCSFNNCRVSAYLKNFFENRIKQNETADTIVQKTVHGFGEEILNDPVVVMFLKEGNQDIVEGLVNGFGEKILATPNSLVINLTLFFVVIFGIVLIAIYSRKNKNRKIAQEFAITESDKNKYLKEAGE
ncbi:MAG: cytochrome c-type biogenesis protein CcmH [Leptospiraceae bacterium]|nr:cytochrome C biogenesis protein [Leptospiraceae bacterium]MCK6381660.1 cytochrome c-type biogenesis protein CcmH [Leptospiraceae bacterium]